MARLLVHVEGPTEESFVNEILCGHLIGKSYESVSARIIGNARLRRQRGGICSWKLVRKDIIRHLRYDPGCIATTMVDFYALPQYGDGAWPGRSRAAALPLHQKALGVEQALSDDISSENIPSVWRRFIPFVVMHEFEALLFSDCAAFSRGVGIPNLEADFKKIREEFGTPEDINDSPEACPSKRIENLIPGYEKPLLGTLAVLEIGLTKIRAECPHFDEWMGKLEASAQP